MNVKTIFEVSRIPLSLDEKQSYMNGKLDYNTNDSKNVTEKNSNVNYLPYTLRGDRENLSAFQYN